MIHGRQLTRGEIESVWSIDRSEVIDAIYRLENAVLVLRPEHHDVRGWPPGETEKYTPILYACVDRGGWAYGLFDDERLIGAAMLDNRWLGTKRDLLLLEFLHVSHAYRGRGLGRRLFNLAVGEARRRGAKGLYISATPSEHTVNLYLRLGCTLISEPDAEMFEREPEDIHLQLVFNSAAVDPS